MNNSFLRKNWFIVLKSSSLKHKPESITLFDTQIVLFRNKGKVIALKDQCLHRGVPLSKGKLCDKGLVCKYHGWIYNTDGVVENIPGFISFSEHHECKLKKYDVLEKGHYIWVRLEKNNTMPFFSDVHDKYPYFTQSMTVFGQMEDILENFLDPMHTHFVHTGVVRSGHSSKRKVCHVTVDNIEQGYEAVYKEEGQQTGIISSLFGRSIIESRGRIISPCVVELIYASKLHKELVVTIHARPNEFNEVKLYIRTYLRPTKWPFWLKAIPLIMFQWLVGYQDKKIIECQYRNINNDSGFSPMNTKIDFMRTPIINVLNDNILQHHSEYKFLV